MCHGGAVFLVAALQDLSAEREYDDLIGVYAFDDVPIGIFEAFCMDGRPAHLEAKEGRLAHLVQLLAHLVHLPLTEEKAATARTAPDPRARLAISIAQRTASSGVSRSGSFSGWRAWSILRQRSDRWVRV